MNSPKYPSTQDIGRQRRLMFLKAARVSRWMHKWVGASLALIMAVLSVTGSFLAYKNHVEYLQPKGHRGTVDTPGTVLSPERIAEIIVASQIDDSVTPDQIDRIELRPAKGIYKVRFERTSMWAPPREIQIDAATGTILNDGVRGDQLWMDIHSFAVFGEGTKLVSMTISGLALFWLSLSGFYLFFYPLWLKAQKRRPLHLP